IPEQFLRGVIEAGIEPILQFEFRPGCGVCSEDLGSMLDAYSNWGVHYVSPYREPNLITNWSATGWSESRLVERFVAKFLPLAERISSAGMHPVFPPLAPGGDYWDTAFLRTALEIISADSKKAMLERLVLGLYAWAGDREICWGAGGPERWPRTKPYTTPEGSEDQMGIRIFDWYKVISEAAFGKSLPMLVLAGGSAPGKGIFDQHTAEGRSHADRNLEIAQALSATKGIAGDLETVPDELLNFNFWLLNQGDDEAEADSAWFDHEAEEKETAAAMIAWQNSKGEKNVLKTPEAVAETYSTDESPTDKSFKHYLLLPTYDWGVADWHLDVIRPFVKKHQPTVGYSLEEASNAMKVTVVGGTKSFSQEMIDGLAARGCEVEQIEGDGTKIASQLMTL
ncbi:MAG: hypothetical protein OEV06_01930, partial [Anaerolineae bacterium]|nr:hypothetical protein [Anaerolineae bacterium]